MTVFAPIGSHVNKTKTIKIPEKLELKCNLLSKINNDKVPYYNLCRHSQAELKITPDYCNVTRKSLISV